MQKKWLPLPVLAVMLITTGLGISSWISPHTIVPLQQINPTSTLIEITPTIDSWIIVDLPEDATQLEYGTEVYRLVCKACHGDKGQGLTDDWRAQWEPEDQNCWQSKCHALNHPPDGFYMPQVPAVLGQPIRGFGTALNLYTYNHKFMPWHDRASMTEEESWSVTAFLLKINGIDPPLELNADNAANIDLSVIDPNLGPTPVPPSLEANPAPVQVDTVTPVPTSQPENQVAESNNAYWIVTFAVLVIVIFVVIFIRRRSAF